MVESYSGKPPILYVQGDGNVAIYGKGGALWHANTWGIGSPQRKLVLRESGELVVIDTKRGIARWSSKNNL